MFELFHNFVEDSNACLVICHLLLLFCFIKCYQMGTKEVPCELIDRLTAAFDKAAWLLQPMTGAATRGHWLTLDSASLALSLAHRLHPQS